MENNCGLEKALTYLLKASMFKDYVLTDDDINLFIAENWSMIKQEACKQAVLPLAAHAASLISGISPSELRNIKINSGINNEQSLIYQNEVLSLFQNIDCAIIKGSSVAVYYPYPELRILGDIDILISGKDIDRSTEILKKNGYIIHESDHKFHIGFNKGGAYIELHYGIYNGYENRAGQAVQNFMESAAATTNKAAINEYIFPVLDVPHQAVTLLIHMLRHMLSSGIGLRQLCDWCMFVNATLHNIDICKDILISCGLLNYAKVLTKTCVLYLGLPIKHCQWCSDIDDNICELLFSDIWRSGNMGHKESEQITANIFSAGAERTDKKVNALSLFISNMNNKTRRYFPVCNKYIILIPVMAVLTIIRSGFRMIIGKRPKVSLGELYKVIRDKNKLYKELGIFKVE